MRRLCVQITPGSFLTCICKYLIHGSSIFAIIFQPPLDNTNALVKITQATGPVAQLVVRLTPDQKVVCSNHIRVIFNPDTHFL